MASLPEVPGPKLAPFHHGKDRLEIEYIKRLGYGIHAEVWKVSIHGKNYALKLFYFEDGEEVDHLGIKLTCEEYLAYIAAFGAECRAYGRLKECNKEHLAVVCHGYLLLGEQEQVKFREVAGIDDRKWSFRWDHQPYMKGWPLRALVKDLVDFEAVPSADVNARRKTIDLTFNGSSPLKVINTIKELHRLGIVNVDPHHANVINGTILEFSVSSTAPHPLFCEAFMLGDRCLTGQADAERVSELIDWWNTAHPDQPPIWHRMVPNKAYQKRLRPRKSDGPWWAKRVVRWETKYLKPVKKPAGPARPSTIEKSGGTEGREDIPEKTGKQEKAGGAAEPAIQAQQNSYTKRKVVDSEKGGNGREKAGKRQKIKQEEKQEGREKSVEETPRKRTRPKHHAKTKA